MTRQVELTNNTQIFQVVKLGNYAFNITIPITIRITEPAVTQVNGQTEVGDQITYEAGYT